MLGVENRCVCSPVREHDVKQKKRRRGAAAKWGCWAKRSPRTPAGRPDLVANPATLDLEAASVVCLWHPDERLAWPGRRRMAGAFRAAGSEAACPRTFPGTRRVLQAEGCAVSAGALTSGRERAGVLFHARFPGMPKETLPAPPSGVPRGEDAQEGSDAVGRGLGPAQLGPQDQGGRLARCPASSRPLLASFGLVSREAATWLRHAGAGRWAGRPQNLKRVFSFFYVISLLVFYVSTSVQYLAWKAYFHWCPTGWCLGASGVRDG